MAIGIVIELHIVVAEINNEQVNETKLSNLKNKMRKRQPYRILTKWAPLDESPKMITTTKIN